MGSPDYVDLDLIVLQTSFVPSPINTNRDDLLLTSESGVGN